MMEAQATVGQTLGDLQLKVTSCIWYTCGLKHIDCLAELFDCLLVGLFLEMGVSALLNHCDLVFELLHRLINLICLLHLSLLDLSGGSGCLNLGLLDLGSAELHLWF